MMADWDRSRDWVLYRAWHDFTRVTIRFQNQRPTVAELIAIRRTLPEFRDVAPADVRKVVGDSGSIVLESMPTPAARQLIASATRNGLDAIGEDVSYVSYLPVDRTNNAGWIIEDDEEAEALAQEMLAEGIPVVNIEA